jgi:hypothetical protein
MIVQKDIPMLVRFRADGCARGLILGYALPPFRGASAPTKVSGSLSERLESNKGFRIVEIESEVGMN